MRRTLVNLHRNSIRRKITERKHLNSAEAKVTPSHDHGVEQAVRVAAALRSLRQVQRATVILRFFEDLPYAEIAGLLDRPLGTVKSAIHRALERLRPLLEEVSECRR